MKSFVLALSMMTLTLGTALAQTDPNTPTGPNNPNPPAQLTGQQAQPPCDPVANNASNGSGAASSMASPAPSPAGQPSSAATGKMAAGPGCAGQDHPASGSMPAPATVPHP